MQKGLEPPISGQNAMIVDEHFLPELGTEIEDYLDAGHVGGAHHLIRYLWAIEIVRRYRRKTNLLLDIACGSGYGSYLIAKEFPRIQVVGADYDPSAVNFAQQNFALPNLKYQHGDAVRWEETIGSDCYDCIVSFDTLEHVSHREIMMQNLVEHLKKSGFLVFSTPSGGDLILRPDWEHHQIEYSASTLYDFLRRYFRTVRKPDSLQSLPALQVFDRMEKSGMGYLLKMNPLICKRPIRIRNPYIGDFSLKLQEYYRLINRGKTFIRLHGWKTFIKTANSKLRK
jgi:SAM-dependent methyltransferase